MDLDPARYLIRTAEGRLRFSWYVWSAEAGYRNRLRAVVRRAELSPTRSFSFRSNPVAMELTGRWLLHHDQARVTACGRDEAMHAQFWVRDRSGKVRIGSTVARIEFDGEGVPRVSVRDDRVSHANILAATAADDPDDVRLNVPGVDEPIDCPLAWAAGLKSHLQSFSEATTRRAVEIGISQELPLGSVAALLATLIPQFAEPLRWSNTGSN